MVVRILNTPVGGACVKNVSKIRVDKRYYLLMRLISAWLAKYLSTLAQQKIVKLSGTF